MTLLLKSFTLTSILSFIYLTATAQHCSNLLVRNENKKDGILSFRTMPQNQSFEAIKSIYHSNTRYLLRLEVLGKSKLPDTFSLTLKFENGAKIERNQTELAGSVTNSSVQNDPQKVYHIAISLSQNDLELLTAHRMTDYKLHRFAVSLKPENQDILQESIKCLVDAK
ncbi:hypothetical protein ACS5NO_14670 [Larkinella sp. GY13]|uniref:hypothetical protein n=1 Tax=Larkinella sp. GY13 TaxID=3453720 RepID=UPI003EEEB940